MGEISKIQDFEAMRKNPVNFILHIQLLYFANSFDNFLYLERKCGNFSLDRRKSK